MLAVVVAGLGVVADNGGLAAYGLGACVAAVFGLAVVAWTSIRGLERRCELLGRARAESERARHALEVTNAELERANADLRAVQVAIVEGFDRLDDQANGRLSELIEKAGEALAEQVDELFGDSWEKP